jgi:hypothetical protein
MAPFFRSRIHALALAALAFPAVALAQSPEDLMATYHAKCTTEAHREAARQGPDAALAHGALCDDLAKRIQDSIQTQGKGAKASPLARPDPTVWPDDGATPPPVQ